MRALFTVLLSLTLLAVLTQAASAQVKQGITVTPSIIRLDLSTDKPEAELFYQNSTNNQIELSFSAQDFSELEEGGRVKFLLEKDAKNYQYSLTSWISFEKQSITLSPGEQQKIKVFVNKDKLTPGGHYAAIQAGLKQSAQEGQQVPVKAILSTLLFVRTATGNEREEISLQSASPIRTLLGFPNTFLIRLQNKGNVELTPYGLIEIKDMFDNTVAKGIINEGSLITLPESIRRFDIPITRQSRFIVPDIYKAEINIHFGKEDKSIREQVFFISQGSINLLLIGLIILAAALISLSARKSLQVRQHQHR